MIKKTVIIFGVFDNIHKGHLHLIKNAKRQGDRLVVIVARDKIVKKLKNKLPKQKEKERVNILSGVSYIDKAILGDKEIETYNVLKKIKPNIIYLGYDQKELFESINKFIKNKDLPKIKIILGKAYKPKTYHSSLLNKKV